MSAAASLLELKKTKNNPNSNKDDEPTGVSEEVAVQKLAHISPLDSGSVIAVDLDDVLSQTNHIVAQYHNEIYGSNMDLSMFYYYYYWKNPYWGTPAETFVKVQSFYATDRIHHAPPVPGAREGVLALKNMGYRLIVVTARTQDTHDETWIWLEKHFPGIFESIVCTSQFKDAHKAGHEVVTKLNKGQVCSNLGAKLLIDDSAENAIQCATHSPPVRVLLFGNYQWNQRLSGAGDHRDEMSFDRRLKAEGGREFWKEEKLEIPEGAPVTRVRDWAEVIRWVNNARQEHII